MRLSHVAIVSVVGLAATALAEVNTRLEYQVSTDGSTWSSSVNVLPNTTIQVRARLSYVGPGTVYGLREVIFQPVVSGWLGTDLLVTTPGSPFGQGIGLAGGNASTPPGVVPDAPGQYGRITPYGAVQTTQTSYIRGHVGTGAQQGMLRIARSNITNWIGAGPTSGSGSVNNFNGRGGVVVGQFHPLQAAPDQPPFSTATLDAAVFRFAFRPQGNATRTMTIGTPELGFGRILDWENDVWLPDCTWWSSAAGFDTANVNQGSAVVVDATVNVIPGPASGAVLCVGLLGARRRTRRMVHEHTALNGLVQRSSRAGA